MYVVAYSYTHVGHRETGACDERGNEEVSPIAIAAKQAQALMLSYKRICTYSIHTYIDT